MLDDDRPVKEIETEVSCGGSRMRLGKPLRVGVLVSGRRKA